MNTKPERKSTMKKTAILIASTLIALLGFTSNLLAGSCNAKPKTKVAAVLAKLNGKPNVCRKLACMKKDFAGIKVTSEQLGQLKGAQVSFRTFVAHNLNPEQITQFQKAGVMSKDFGGAKAAPEKLKQLTEAQTALGKYLAHVLTPEQMIQVDFKNPVFLAAPQIKPSTCGKK